MARADRDDDRHRQPGGEHEQAACRPPHEAVEAGGVLAPRGRQAFGLLDFELALALLLSTRLEMLAAPLEDRLGEHVVEELVALLALARRRRQRSQDPGAARSRDASQHAADLFRRTIGEVGEIGDAQRDLAA